MNVLELIAREHARIERDLQAYESAVQSAEALALARRVAARVAAYVQAEERSLFLALVAVADDETIVPIALHDRIKRRTTQVLALCTQHDSPLLPVMRKLRQDLRSYAQHESTQLRSTLAGLFTASELRQIGGELLLQLASHRRRDAASHGLDLVLGAALARVWRITFATTRGRRGPRSRFLPTLRDAVPASRPAERPRMLAGSAS